MFVSVFLSAIVNLKKSPFCLSKERQKTGFRCHEKMVQEFWGLWILTSLVVFI